MSLDFSQKQGNKNLLTYYWQPFEKYMPFAKAAKTD
jgi:hypothetical protein